MDKKKKYLLISLIVIILIIVFNVVYNNNSKKPNVKKDVARIVKTVTDENLTYDDFTKLVGTDVANINIVTGPNSYLRNKPKEDIIKKYNLEKYVELQDELARRVEKRYVDNLKYKIMETQNLDNKECHVIRITAYYYELYMHDLLNLINAQLDMDISEIVNDSKAQAEYLKKEVLALKVLDNHLDDYENKIQESSVIRLCYKNGKIESNDMILSLVLAFRGNGYLNVDFSNEQNVKAAQARLSKYLDELKKTKLFE